ncbi:MAG: type II secretion system protein [Candidatus Paceibacterota bacterium]
MSKAFTLIELVIVIAILAILAAVVVITINPAEQMKSARDSTRMSDFASIKSSIGLYLADGKTTMGSANTVYVSVPDSSATCANLGLPSLPAGWSYHCSTSANLQKTDSTGWIPINFTQISFGNVLQSLPIDPINTTSTGNYYSYVTGGSYQLATVFESSKYNQTLTSQYYTIGTATNLMPTVTLVASSTGVTMNLSTANGYAFITSSSLNLTPYINRYVIISDGTNNIQGFIKAQGSGETLGNELIVNGDMELDSSWGNYGSLVTSNIRSNEQAHGGIYGRKIISPNGYGATQIISSVNTGALYFATGYIYTAVGAGRFSYKNLADNFGYLLTSSYNFASWTSIGNRYFTINNIGLRIILEACYGGSSTLYYDDASIKQVLTPSASGVTITNTRGGSTYNWATNSGINPNVASFTVTVSP